MSNNIEVKIDYFSATFPLMCDAEDSLLFKVHEMVRLMATYLNVKNHEIVRSKYSQNNYNYQYILGEYIILRLDGPLNACYQRTCHLEMKGDACRDFENRNKDKNWINFLLFMAQLNSNFKRIDIAIDDFKGDMNGLKEKARQGGWNRGFAPYGYRLENFKLQSLAFFNMIKSFQNFFGKLNLVKWGGIRWDGIIV